MGKTYKTYSEYLSLDKVLGASCFLQDDPDQMCFAINHQITELWFKLILVELNRFIDTNELCNLLRAEVVMRQINGIWEVFESINVHDFLRIRSNLQGVSGAASEQYFEIERVLQRCSKCCDDRNSMTILSKIDTGLSTWKFVHLQITKKFIGDATGTGGTSGAKYLDKKGTMPLITQDDLKKH